MDIPGDIEDDGAAAEDAGAAAEDDGAAADALAEAPEVLGAEEQAAATARLSTDNDPVSTAPRPRVLGRPVIGTRGPVVLARFMGVWLLGSGGGSGTSYRSSPRARRDQPAGCGIGRPR